MRYTSTRDESVSVSFEEAICSGYASGGGLYVPRTLPKVGADTHLKPWSSLPYPDLAHRILRMFVSADEISDDDLKSICEASFGDGFEDGRSAVTVRTIGSLFLAELFHGPTFCFKDLGMRPLVNLLSHFATLRQRSNTLLVSTTGDTGPAAVHAVSDAANPLLTLLVHYPLGQISSFQRKQLTTVVSPFVRVASFEGGGDDMDIPIKRILTSPKSTDNASHTSDRMMCGVNSYNIGRPLSQMIHFIWIYLRVVEQLGIEPGDSDAKVNFVLPTGAMGNIVGGYMAKKIGVPIGMLCAGVNVNDITHRVMTTGQFHKMEHMERTLSEAINIQIPYNFERLLYYLSDENHDLVCQWMTTMDATEKLNLDEAWLETLQTEFCSERVTDDEMCCTMRSVRDNFDYYIDPHTAVAMCAAEKLGYTLFSKQPQDVVPTVILATASPCKFQEAVSVALGEDGWNQYVKSSFFPPRAQSIITTKSEIVPTFYPRTRGDTLAGAQIEWEAMARKIIIKHFS